LRARRQKRDLEDRAEQQKREIEDLRHDVVRAQSERTELKAENDGEKNLGD
jgi:septal ring factor EnvC (AmiA/AmiB activator)